MKDNYGRYELITDVSLFDLQLRYADERRYALKIVCAVDKNCIARAQEQGIQHPMFCIDGLQLYFENGEEKSISFDRIGTRIERVDAQSDSFEICNRIDKWVEVELPEGTLLVTGIHPVHSQAAVFAPFRLVARKTRNGKWVIVDEDVVERWKQQHGNQTRRVANI